MLEMNALELQTFLAQQLEENPLLEETEESPETGEEELVAEEREEQEESGDDEEDHSRESARPETLAVYLRFQLQMAASGERERSLGEAIISSLDERGYFRGDLAQIAASVGTDPAEASAALALVQSFDPPGVAAGDLRECLLLQLRERSEDTLLGAAYLLGASREGDACVAPAQAVELLEELPSSEAKDDSAAGEARPIDQERIQRAVREILEAIGEDPEREGLRHTPGRIARMYAEFFSGSEEQALQQLAVGFREPHSEMILIRNIAFHSICEHHLLPFSGCAHVAYIPRGKIVGLSKIARTVDILARRPQIQERLTSLIADVLERGLDPMGVAVVVEAEHLCIVMRGVKKPGSFVTTSALRGGFRTNPATRAEFFSLVASGRERL